jgi:hypothetical protein
MCASKSAEIQSSSASGGESVRGQARASRVSRDAASSDASLEGHSSALQRPAIGARHIKTPVVGMNRINMAAADWRFKGRRADAAVRVFAEGFLKKCYNK